MTLFTQRWTVLLTGLLVASCVSSRTARPENESLRSTAEAVDATPVAGHLRRVEISDFAPTLSAAVAQQSAVGTRYLSVVLANPPNGQSLWVNARFEVAWTGTGANTLVVEELGSEGRVRRLERKIRGGLERRYALLGAGESVQGEVSLSTIEFTGPGPWRIRLRYRDRGDWPIPLPPEDVPWFSGEVISNEVEIPALPAPP